jgi:hypothetical protein
MRRALVVSSWMVVACVAAVAVTPAPAQETVNGSADPRQSRPPGRAAC